MEVEEIRNVASCSVARAVTARDVLTPPSSICGYLRTEIAGSNVRLARIRLRSS